MFQLKVSYRRDVDKKTPGSVDVPIIGRRVSNIHNYNQFN